MTSIVGDAINPTAELHQVENPPLASEDNTSAKDKALQDLDSARERLADIEIFQQHVSKSSAFDDEDIQKVNEAVEKSRETVRCAEEVFKRYEQYFEKLQHMYAQLATRLELLRNHEQRVDLSGKHRDLGKYFREKQLRLSGIAEKLEIYLKNGNEVHQENSQ